MGIWWFACGVVVIVLLVDLVVCCLWLYLRMFVFVCVWFDAWFGYYVVVVDFLFCWIYLLGWVVAGYVCFVFVVWVLMGLVLVLVVCVFVHYDC